MQDIQTLLGRRTDLSAFVVHLTRDSNDAETKAKDNLLSIVKQKKIEARNVYGWAASRAQDLSPKDAESQKVACFSEVPLEQVYSMYATVTERQVKLRPYGIAFTRLVARKLGANPVWYVDMTPGQRAQWAISTALDSMRDEAINTLAQSNVGKILPFCEQMGEWPGGRKEFWWEREWRCRGDLRFDWDDIAFLLSSESDHGWLKDELSRITGFPENLRGRILDPAWSLEVMIAQLAGIPKASIAPFRTR